LVNRKPSATGAGRPNLDTAAGRLARVAEAGSRAGDPAASASHSEFPGARTSRSWDGSENPCI